jgi:hypothetical protein
MRTGFCTARGAGLSGLKKLGGACAVLVGALSLVSVATPAHAVPINVTYTDSADEGFNDPSLGVLRRRSFEAAAAVWSRRLAGSVPINVSASFDPLGGDARSATLGSAGPSGLFPDWSGGTPPPAANTFYVSALANNLAGRDLDGAEADIEARFNSDLDGPNVFGSSGFYYGLDGNPPAGDVDFFPVVLHELGHGLGFTGLFRQDGTTSAGAFASFDRFLANGPSAGAALLPDFGNAADRAQLLRSNSLFFAGPRARAAFGSNPRVYAPLEYDGGSSTYHTDEASFSGAEELMTPFSTGAPRDAGPVTFAMFLDLGWGSVGGSPSPTPTPTTAAPTPTPANRPANDAFAAAQYIGGATGRVTGSSVNGTKENGELNHAQNAGGASIWYRWVAPATGRATFETTGSSFDTLLAVYTGSSVDALTLVAQNDDIEVNVNRASRITFDVVAGRTYFFAVDGYRTGGTFESGSVVLVWTATAAPSPTPTAAPVPTATPVPTLPPVVRPANDLFERAQVLSGVAARVGGTTLNATTQVGEPRHAGVGAGRSVWYRWTAPRTGRWTFTTQGSNLDTALALYSGASVNALRLLAADDDDLPLRTSSVSFVLAPTSRSTSPWTPRAQGAGRLCCRSRPPRLTMRRTPRKYLWDGRLLPRHDCLRFAPGRRAGARQLRRQPLGVVPLGRARERHRDLPHRGQRLRHFARRVHRRASDRPAPRGVWDNDPGALTAQRPSRHRGHGVPHRHRRQERCCGRLRPELEPAPGLGQRHLLARSSRFGRHGSRQWNQRHRVRRSGRAAPCGRRGGSLGLVPMGGAANRARHRRHFQPHLPPGHGRVRRRRGERAASAEHGRHDQRQHHDGGLQRRRGPHLLDRGRLVQHRRDYHRRAVHAALDHCALGSHRASLRAPAVYSPGRLGSVTVPGKESTRSRRRFFRRLLAVWRQVLARRPARALCLRAGML